jgi:hypothetical protein
MKLQVFGIEAITKPAVDLGEKPHFRSDGGAQLTDFWISVQINGMA